MNRTLFNSPFLLGFEHIERLLERTAKSESYPPYNIEHTDMDRLKITLAVAGFRAEDLSVSVEDNQLVIRGRVTDPEDKTFLHRGIASRQFQRSFVLAEGSRCWAPSSAMAFLRSKWSVRARKALYERYRFVQPRFTTAMLPIRTD